MTKGEETFNSLGLCPEVVSAVNKYGWVIPTPIQQNTISKALEGEDVVGNAVTGSGKTGAYILPVIDLLLKAGKPKKFAVILAPSRELVLQIAEVCDSLTEGMEITTATAYGGVDDVEQMAQLSKDPNIIIATPGRLSQLLQEAKGFNLKSTKIVVVDEADKMAAVVFYDDIRAIVSSCNFKRQLLLFSATMPKNVQQLADLATGKASIVSLSQRTDVPSTLQENIVVVLKEKKDAALAVLLEEYKDVQVLIFAGSCRYAQILHDTLKEAKFSVGLVHGNIDQKVRMEQISLFRSNEIRILVSSDVASRGLDIPNIDVVINYHVPTQTKEYIHRSGRAGRAGRAGIAFTFVTKEEISVFQQLETFLKRKIALKKQNDEDIMHWIPIMNSAKEKAVEQFKINSRKENPNR